MTMADDQVKIYIFENELGRLYWTEYPISTVGDWKRYSEDRSFMIPHAKLDRWKAAEAVNDGIAREMQALTENG
jgi:hypothetical protein